MSQPYQFSTEIKLINRLLALFPQREISADRILEGALGRNYSLDDDVLADRLSTLCHSISSESDLHPLGRFLISQKLQRDLRTRMKIISSYQSSSEPPSPLPKILLITGMQRTGTTLLQRMLSSLEGFRGLKSWEVLDPVPSQYPGNSTMRKAKARIAQSIMERVNPEFGAIHKIRWDWEEEDVTLLDLSFLSTTYEAMLRVPSYAAWIETQDYTPAYDFLKLSLQVMLKDEQLPEVLILKSPHHMECLDVLFKVFDDVRVVQLHRDPMASIPSMFSLSYQANKTFCTHRDPFEIGQHWLTKCFRMYQSSLESRQNLSSDLFMDIDYTQLMSNPTTAVEKIYNFCGLQWSPSINNQVQTYISDHPKGQHGNHNYRLSDFGISPEIIRNTFKPLYDYFVNP